MLIRTPILRYHNCWNLMAPVASVSNAVQLAFAIALSNMMPLVKNTCGDGV